MWGSHAAATMIDLGLARISRLLRSTPQSWRAIHVAGTNGKGSVCAYLSAMLHASGVSCARFTSPHIIDRWDCITVDERPVSEALFRDVEALVLRRNEDHQIGATQFELLTATAFEIFNRARVEYGVVEVGMGGGLDATNALKEKAVAVITKIGLDHQGFLGSTVEDIALHKAGIIRQGVPCVVDGSNQQSVLSVIEAHAKEVGAPVVYPAETAILLDDMASDDLEPHQLQNLACAVTAFKLACPRVDASLARLLPVIKQVQWPGRLQFIDLSKLTGRREKVLLDGAHNPQSAQVLSAYVNKHIRSQGDGVTWVVATSEGKDVGAILDLLLQPEDQVAAVRFGPVDGMPWVKAMNPAAIIDVALEKGVKGTHDGSDADLQSVLRSASTMAGSGPVVIAGSLYLVSDTLRLLRSMGDEK